MNFPRKEQIKNQGPVTQEVIDTIIISREGLSEKTWAKMDKFDRDFYKRSLAGTLLKIEKEDVFGAIYDHEAAGNWDVAQVLRTLRYKND
jgi:hypothetical protein